jgi:hypothetical protein
MNPGSNISNKLHPAFAHQPGEAAYLQRVDAGLFEKFTLPSVRDAMSGPAPAPQISAPVAIALPLVDADDDIGTFLADQREDAE